MVTIVACKSANAHRAVPQRSNGVAIMIVDEEYGGTLLDTRICQDTQFTTQGGKCGCDSVCGLWATATSLDPASADTIITWQDPETGSEMALSFQEEGGFTSAWCV